MNTTNVLITCILSSTVAAALVNAIKEFILWKLNRKSIVSDRAEEKGDRLEELSQEFSGMQEQINKITEICNNLEVQLGVTIKSNKVILQDRIKHLVFSYAKLEEISYEDKKLIHEMWRIYHYELSGNGDLDDVMEMLDEIPLKIK